jgi:hypothetical protein
MPMRTTPFDPAAELPDLSVTVEAGPPGAVEDGHRRFGQTIIRITNVGPVPAVADTLNLYLYASPHPVVPAISGTFAGIRKGMRLRLAPGQTMTVRNRYHINLDEPEGLYYVMVDVQAWQLAEPRMDNNTGVGPQVELVRPRADLAVTAFEAPPPHRRGTKGRAYVTVTNRGATAVRTPAYVEVAERNAAGESTGPRFFGRGMGFSLRPGASRRVAVPLRFRDELTPGPLDVNVSVHVSRPRLDPDPTNDTLVAALLIE